MEKKAPLTKAQREAEQVDQLSDLKRAQIQEANGGQPLATTTANRNPKYKIRVIEAADYVHVLLTTKHLNEQTKSITTEESVIAIHAREFDRRVKEGIFKLSDEAQVIHDPRPNAPQSYDLRPNTLEIDANGPKADPNIALREKKLAAKEQALAEKEGEREELWKKEQDRLAERSKSLDEMIEENKRKSAELDRMISEEQNALSKSTTSEPAGPKIQVEPETTAASSTAGEPATATKATVTHSKKS